MREFPEVRYTLATINTGARPARSTRRVYVRLVDRKPAQAQRRRRWPASCASA